MTAHEHWLVCQLHVLWKFDKSVCESEDCVKCSLYARRPPQLWRKTGVMERSLRHLDALICPSLSTMHEHARRGIKARMTHLPYFLPRATPACRLPPSPSTRVPTWRPRGGSRRSRGSRTSSTRCDAPPTSTPGSPA